jgi:hypothetical protein
MLTATEPLESGDTVFESGDTVLEAGAAFESGARAAFSACSDGFSVEFSDWQAVRKTTSSISKYFMVKAPVQVARELGEVCIQ